MTWNLKNKRRLILLLLGAIGLFVLWRLIPWDPDEPPTPSEPKVKTVKTEKKETPALPVQKKKDTATPSKKTLPLKVKAPVKKKTAALNRELVEQTLQRAMDQAAALLETKQFEEAKEVLNKFLTSFESRDPEDRLFLIRVHQKAKTRLQEIDGLITRHDRELYQKDLTYLLKNLDTLKLEQQLLAFDLKGAAASYELVLKGVKSRPYTDHLTSLRLGLVKGAGLLDRLIQTMEKKELIKQRIFVSHMDPEDQGRLIGLMEGEKGVKILAERGGGARILSLEFSRFIGPQDLIALLNNRFPMMGEDKLALAELAIHLAAVKNARHLFPLRQRIRNYDPQKGWDRQGLGLTPLNFEHGDLILALIQEGELLEDGLSKEAERLRNLVASESLAVESLHQGLAPLFSHKSDTEFLQAEKELRNFATHYSQTMLFWYTWRLVGPSVREGGHLMEFY